MRIRILIAALTCLLPSPCCLVSRSPLPPGAEISPAYTEIDDTVSYPGETLFAYMDGGAEIFQEYGYCTAWVRRYRAKGRELTVELFEMNDPDAAAGIFSYIRNSGRQTEIVRGCRGTLTESEAKLSKGRFLLICRDEDPMSADPLILSDLAGRLSDRLEGACDASFLFVDLPEEGRIAGSEVFLAGPVGLSIRPWLDSQSKEGFRRGWFSRYRVGDQEAEAFLAQYTTSDDALSASQGLALSARAGVITLAKGNRMAAAHGTGVGDQLLLRLAQRLLATN